MLMVTQLSGFGVGGGGRVALFDAIQSVGATAGLAECWDLSDSGAYVSGQTITDQSGNGNHVWFGDTSGSDATDPTFAGTAGAKVLATHASVDGGDFFRLSITNPASLDNAHKDNAKFVLLLLYKSPSSLAANYGLFGTDGASLGNVGVQFFTTSAAKLRFDVANGVIGALTKISDGTLSTSTNYAVAVSINEAAGAAGGYLWANGAYMQVGAADTWDPAYTSPSSSASSFTAEYLALSNAQNPQPSGALMYGFARWDTTIPTKANLDSIYALLTSTSGRLGA